MEGKLRYKIGEETIDLESDDCIRIPKNTPHDWINLQSEPARIIGVLTSGGSEDFFKTAASEHLDNKAFMRLVQGGENN